MPLAGPQLTSPFDLRTMVSEWADRKPDEIAVASSEREVTWAELDRAAADWAGALTALGLVTGDRVASLMPNRIDLVIHYLGCLRAGLVAVPLNYRYVARQIDHALGVSNAATLLVHVERAEDVASSEATDALEHGCIWYGDPPDGQPGPSFGELMAQQAPAPPTATGDADPAFIFFTSGSTGPSKGVTHTVDTAGWMAAAAAQAFEMSEADIFLPASSMSHLGAFLWSIASFGAGVKVVVAHSVDGDEVLGLIRAHRPTLMAMIPAALTAVIRDHGATAEDFASFRVCRAGADHVPAELDVEFEALTGFPIDEGYGMSETGLATLNPPQGPIKVGSIGKVIAGMEISIRGEGGSEVPVGDVGTIWMRSRAATVGYWNAPQATSELWRDGWLDSGDLARRDDDGYLWFFGRRKQVIVHDGSNISPQEVEDALSEHPVVAAVGVVGIHDAVHGEDVRAYVTIREGAQRPTSQELIRFARERVGYRAPEEIVFLDAIPLNPTGKIDRHTLKQIAEDHRNPHRPG